MKVKEAKIKEIRNSLDQIIERLDEQSHKGMKLHQAERHLFSSLLRLGLQLLEYYIVSVGLLVVGRGAPSICSGEKMKNTGKRSRLYWSVFGQVRIERNKYCLAGAQTYYPLDEALGLPKSNYSYVLDDWLSYAASDMDFAQSVEQLERILGHSLWAMQSSRRSYALSQEVETFYDQQDWTELEDGSHLSIGYDGKGVAMKGEERELQSVSIRLGKGKKKGIKKEATVSVSSSFTPKPRQMIYWIACFQ